MGNRHSRRKHRKMNLDYEDNEDTDQDKQVGSFDDIQVTPDSYDKLITWMVEMAQNDDSVLESPAFVEHITTAFTETRDTLSPFNSRPPLKQQSFDGPVRQHSYDSSCSSRNSRASRSRDDLLDPRTRFRRSLLSRQATVDYSDEGDSLGVPMDISGGSSFDNDYDVNPQTMLLGNMGETSFTNERVQEAAGYSGNKHPILSNSVGDLLHGRKCLTSTMRKKSRSLMTVKRGMSETRNDDEITPIYEETVVKILDNKFLQENMSDILLSVEALWPNVPKQMSSNSIK